ncbi:hypothetical protein TWF730_005981 [Orbilia blumenaviensis]|uniref:Uncharacterized protein n=1 Tax=Orbilia blumenaviensis TaxID=1796055 RepID=A0AAV9VR53_9PEZI
MPREFVKTGIWELYGEPFQKRWIWTLEDSDAFWLLGLYVVTLAVVQQRTWSILRHYLARWRSPVGFSDQANPLLKLSQTAALKDSLAYFRIRGPQYLQEIGRSIAPSYFREHDLREAEIFDGGAIPWLFGLVALINSVGFIATGILMPLLLTSGVEAPLVRTRWTPLCDKRRFDIGVWVQTDARSHGSGLYDLCWDVDNLCLFDKPECSSSTIEGLEITLRNTTDCPFPENICFADGNTPQVLTIKHYNITLRQLGLNSRSRVTINHEISCSPLNLDHFVWPLPSGNSVLSFRDFTQGETPTVSEYGDIYGLKLETLNGPNMWTNVSSGTYIATSNRSQSWGQSSTFPQDEYFISQTPGRTETQPLHPFIRSDDATFFAVVYQAGPRTTYMNPVDDPVFRAYVYLEEDLELSRYHPDHEATAIGCMEKFQFCPNIPGGLQCSAWGRWWDRIRGLDALFPLGHLDDRREAAFTVKEITRELSLYTNKAPLVGAYPANRAPLGDRTGSWAEQIVPAYLELWWGTIYRIQRVATSTRIPTDYMTWPPPGYSGDWSLHSQEESDRWSWCHRVLLTDPDYTNINFFGFCISLIIISSIYTFSYGGHLRSLLA